MLHPAKFRKALSGCLKSRTLARCCIEIMGEGGQLRLTDLRQVSVAG